MGDIRPMAETKRPEETHSENVVEDNALATDNLGFVTDLENLPPGYYRSKFFIGSCAATAMAILAGVSAFGYPAPLLGYINADLGPDANYIWISYVYNTCLAVTFPLLGRLSDIFGRRYFFIGGAVLATIGSIICATSTTIPMLIGGNVFLGVASATQLSYHIVLGELVPTRYRYVVIAILYMATIPGSGFGPAIGNAILVNHPKVGWRGVYYIIIGYNVIALVLWVAFYFPPNFRIKHGRTSKLEWVKHFDYVGAGLLISGFVVFLFGLSTGGTQYAWGSAPPIVMIVLGFLTLCGLGVWETRMKLREPIAPPHIFRNRAWVATVVTEGFAASIYYTTAIIWPQQVAVLYANGNQIQGGLLSILPGLGNIGGQMVGGPFQIILKKQKWQTMISMGLGATFVGCCALVNTDNRALLTGLVFMGNFAAGWAEILLLPNSTILIRDQQEIGTAGGLGAALRTGVSAVSTVVYGTVLTNRLTTQIPAVVAPAIVKAGLPSTSVVAFLEAINVGTAAAFGAVPGITPTIIEIGLAAYKTASAGAYRTVYLVSIAFGVTGFFCACFTANAETMVNDKVAATLGREGVQGHVEAGKDATEMQHTA